MLADAKLSGKMPLDSSVAMIPSPLLCLATTVSLCAHVTMPHLLLTFGVHAQRGLRYLVCVSVCLFVCLSTFILELQAMRQFIRNIND